jgi:hypothetical protein
MKWHHLIDHRPDWRSILSFTGDAAFGLPLVRVAGGDGISVLAYERGATIGSNHYRIGARLCVDSAGS